MAPLVSIGPTHLKIKRKPCTTTAEQRLAELTRKDEEDRLAHAQQWNNTSSSTTSVRPSFAYAVDPKDVKRQQNKYLLYFRSTTHDAETVQSILARGGGGGGTTTSSARPSPNGGRGGGSVGHRVEDLLTHQPQQPHQAFDQSHGSTSSQDVGGGGTSSDWQHLGYHPNEQRAVPAHRWPHLPQVDPSPMSSTPDRSSYTTVAKRNPQQQKSVRGGAAVDLRALHPKSAVIYVKYEKLLRRMKHEDDEFMAFRRRYLAQHF